MLNYLLVNGHFLDTLYIFSIEIQTRLVNGQFDQIEEEDLDSFILNRVDRGAFLQTCSSTFFNEM